MFVLWTTLHRAFCYLLHQHWLFFGCSDLARLFISIYCFRFCISISMRVFFVFSSFWSNCAFSSCHNAIGEQKLFVSTAMTNQMVLDNCVPFIEKHTLWIETGFVKEKNHTQKIYSTVRYEICVVFGTMTTANARHWCISCDFVADNVSMILIRFVLKNASTFFCVFKWRVNICRSTV